MNGVAVEREHSFGQQADSVVGTAATVTMKKQTPPTMVRMIFFTRDSFSEVIESAEGRSSHHTRPVNPPTRHQHTHDELHFHDPPIQWRHLSNKGRVRGW